MEPGRSESEGVVAAWWVEVVKAAAGRCGDGKGGAMWEWVRVCE